MRDSFIIFFAIILALIIGAYLFFNKSTVFSPSAPQTAEQSGSFTILQQGSYAGAIDTRTNYRIESDEELVALWGLIYGTNGPVVPSVDFTKYEIIAVFDGSHSTGGFKVEVTDIADANGKRTVHIRHTAPGDRCITPQAITSPFQVVRALKTTLPITREEESVVTPC